MNPIIRKWHAALEKYIALNNEQMVSMLDAADGKPNAAKPVISVEHFSRYRKATQLGKGISPRMMEKLQVRFDTCILRDLNLVWDEDILKYISNEQQKLNHDETLRLQALLGHWVGFSWDKVNSKDNDGYIHIYTIHFEALNKITCVTKGGTFEGNKMVVIADTRVAIEMSHPKRKIYIIIYIGTTQEDGLLRKQSLKLGYVDSGGQHVKSGLAIIERIQNPESIEPGSKPVSYFQNTEKEYLIRELKETQYLI